FKTEAFRDGFAIIVGAGDGLAALVALSPRATQELQRGARRADRRRRASDPALFGTRCCARHGGRSFARPKPRGVRRFGRGLPALRKAAPCAHCPRARPLPAIRLDLSRERTDTTCAQFRPWSTARSPKRFRLALRASRLGAAGA